MGDKIILENIKILPSSNGLLQMDMYNETKNKQIRMFVEPGELFCKLGNAYSDIDMVNENKNES